MKFFTQLLFGLRKIFQNKTNGIMSRFQNPETNKLKYFSPKTWRMLLIGIGMTFLIAVVLSNFLSPNEKKVGGFDAFQKDMKPSIGVNGEPDVFTNTLNSSSLEFSIANEKAKNGGLLGSLEKELNSMGDGKNKFGGGNGGSGNGRELTATDCLNIFDKVKANTKLNDDEKVQSLECLENNLASLSESEQEAYKRLLDESISDEEKKAIRKSLNSEYDPGSPEDKILSELLDGNKNAELCLESIKARDKKAMEICAKSLDGEDLTAEEKNKLAEYEKILKENKKPESNNTNESNAQKQTEGVSASNSGSDNESRTKNLAKEIAADEEKRKETERMIKDAEKKAKEAAKKIADGQAAKLTQQEQEAIQKIAQLNKELESITKMQEQRKKEFAKSYAELQKSLMQIDATIKQTYPSGIYVDFAEIPNCRTVATLTPKKRKETPKKREEKEVYLDSNGQALTPDKIRYVQLLRQQKYEFEKMKQDAKNPMGEQNAMNGDVRERIATNGASQNQFQINELKVMSGNALKAFELTPDMKIPAIIDSPITVSSNQKGMIFRVKIIANIHDPRTGKLLIPKGSIAIANAGNFDNDTGIMNVTISKISVGSGKTIDVNLTLGSADGSIGLKGKVYDTSGQYLAGTFIAAFSSGALNYFSQEIVQPFQQSNLLADAITGAAGSGGAEVMQKVAEMYAQKLQNAPTIFWCPKKVPVILYPN